jgi:predicted nucleic acid-binding protein
MGEVRRGLLDTSVIIDHDVVEIPLLPEECAIAAITVAEPSAGPLATDDQDERARRQERLQWASATLDPLPFDADAARAYGRVFAAVRAAGKTPRSRYADLLIAATAVANNLPIYTRNPSDFAGLDDLVHIVRV